MDFSSVSNEKKEEMIFIAICKLGDTQQMGVARSGFDQKEQVWCLLSHPRTYYPGNMEEEGLGSAHSFRSSMLTLPH